MIKNALKVKVNILKVNFLMIKMKLLKMLRGEYYSIKIHSEKNEVILKINTILCT